MTPRQLYRMHDVDHGGAIPCDEATACTWNDPSLGYGIFWTVNDFHGAARRIENLKRIRSWAVDIDTGTKVEQAAKISKAPLVPSLIVEVKRGFHVYYDAKDAKPEHWNAIVLDRLVPFFGADANARDLARILRAPGYLHLKDPRDPFRCEVRHAQRVAYSEMQIAEKFADVGGEARRAKEAREAQREVRAVTARGDDFWQAVSALDCEEGLRRLSGHPAVGGEVYTFRPNRAGTSNIIVNGKGCGAWIDRDRRIGSFTGGGPTIYAWLRWFGNAPGECAAVIKSLYPELARFDRRAA